MKGENKQTVIDWIGAHHDLIVDAHQQAWECAKVGLQEHQASALLADILDENGFTVE